MLQNVRITVTSAAAPAYVQSAETDTPRSPTAALALVRSFVFLSLSPLPLNKSYDHTATYTMSPKANTLDF